MAVLPRSFLILLAAALAAVLVPAEAEARPAAKAPPDPAAAAVERCRSRNVDKERNCYAAVLDEALAGGGPPLALQLLDRLAALEREIEETRERLAGTIDQLLYRSHPKTIVQREVASVKAYYVDPTTGEPRTDNILKTAGIVAGVVGLFVVIRLVARD